MDDKARVVRRGRCHYLLPVNGTDTKWYKYVIANPEIELSVRGRKVRAQARPMDAQMLADVIDWFRSKYGELKRYYRKLDAAIAVNLG